MIAFPPDLPTIWMLLVGVLFAGYAMLDGFDLGVGALHLFVKGDHERRILLNAIGPVWDGNEVWLVTGAGAIFAAFPELYATATSAFYEPIMLLLFALIFRAVAIEFRSKRESPRWRAAWDASFSLSSLLGSFIIGVALGNVIWGLPMDETFLSTAGLFDLLHPYALAVGVMMVALFTMHGAIYLILKTEGALQEKLRSWVKNAIIFFIICYALVSMATLVYVDRMAQAFRDHPGYFIIAVLTLLAVANIPREVTRERFFAAFFSSCMAILGLMGLFAVGTYPTLLPNLTDPVHSLTIYNAASSGKTLRIMLLIAAIGVPLVLSYTIGIYFVFRGKVRLDAHSY